MRTSRSIFHLLVYHVKVKKNGTRCGMLGHETNRVLPILFMGAMLTPCTAEYCSSERSVPPRNSAEMTDAANRLLSSSAWARHYVAHKNDRPYYEHKFVSTEWMGRASSMFDSVSSRFSTLRDSSSPRRVLDLGSGPGWFVWVLRQKGFLADGLQPMAHNQAPPNMTRLLGVEPVDFAIAPRTPLPRPSCRYDMVTAWLMCLDRACTYGKDHKHVQGRDDAEEEF